MANVSVEYSVGGVDNSGIDLLITPISCGASGCADFYINLAGRFAWSKVGNITNPTPGSMLFAPVGLSPFTIHATDPTATVRSFSYSFHLGSDVSFRKCKETA